MSEAAVSDCITLAARLRDAPARVYLACTGAGAGLQQILWSVPGCSSFFAGAEFPYDQEATERLLGFRPEKFCSIETAVDLALESYARACVERGAVTESEPVGLGLTASVASLVAHRGDHRVCAAVATRRGVWVASRVLDKGVGHAARDLDGRAADWLGLGLILHAAGAGLAEGARAEPGVDAETVLMHGLGPTLVCDASALARRRFLARGLHTRDGRRLPVTPAALGRAGHLFPGAFNPPHAGHFAIADSVQSATGAPVVFAVTANAPHKPPVQLAELVERAALLRGYDRMFTEDDPLYLDKARRYPNRAIVLGADAFRRLLDPKWGPAVAPMVREFDQLGTRFLVFGRLTDGTWLTREDALRELSATVDADTVAAASELSASLAGRWDISSSELRAADEAQRQEIARRLAEVESGTAELMSWEEFRARRAAFYSTAESSGSSASGVAECACYHTCAEGPRTERSQSGDWHQHEGEPCPVHTAGAALPAAQDASRPACWPLENHRWALAENGERCVDCGVALRLAPGV